MLPFAQTPFFWGTFWDLPEQYARQLMSDFHNIRVVLQVLKHSEFIHYTFKAVWITFLSFGWGPSSPGIPQTDPCACTFFTQNNVKLDHN